MKQSFFENSMSENNVKSPRQIELDIDSLLHYVNEYDIDSQSPEVQEEW